MSMMRKQRRGRMRRSVGILAAGAMMVSGMNHAMALPQGGQVAAGAAEIAASQTEMAIHQATQNAVINWQSFGIAAGERVNIFQPNAQAALLNRVLGNNPSEIFGTLSANGRVFLVNPAGVLFAPGAQVDAGSIVASTMNITNADFMAGKYAFVGTPNDGKVINRASLIAKNEGTVALLGKDVVNEGVIVAKKGAAVLASGEAVSLDFNGDGKDDLAVKNGNVFSIKYDLTTSGPADATVTYGRPDDVGLAGDWDGDGKDTLGVRRGNMNYLRNSLSGGKADVAYAYGRATDTAVAGDWDADGKDSVWVRRGNVLYVRDVLQGGDADLTLAYGRATDKLIVGDWEKDKTDTIGLVRQ